MTNFSIQKKQAVSINPAIKQDIILLMIGITFLTPGFYLKYYYYPEDPMLYEETRFNENWFLSMGAAITLTGLYKLIRRPFSMKINSTGIELPKWRCEIPWDNILEIRSSDESCAFEGFIILLVKNLEEIENANKLCIFADAHYLVFYKNEIPIPISESKNQIKKFIKLIEEHCEERITIHPFNSIVDTN